MPTVRRPYPKSRKARASVLSRSAKPKTLPAGCYVWEELQARGWSWRTLAQRMDVPLSTVRAIVAGGVVTTAEAAALTRAFGSTAGLWSHLDGLYREHLALKR